MGNDVLLESEVAGTEVTVGLEKSKTLDPAAEAAAGLGKLKAVVELAFEVEPTPPKLKVELELNALEVDDEDAGLGKLNWVAGCLSSENDGAELAGGKLKVLDVADSLGFSSDFV